MKTQKELRSLVQAFQTVTKELASATVTEDLHDKVLVAMLLMPLLPTLDGFMASLKEEMQAAEEKPAEDPLDKLLDSLRSNGSVS